jgi:hypothetical protein
VVFHRKGPGDGGDDSHPAMRVDDPNPPTPALRMSSGTAAVPPFHPSPCEDSEVFTGDGFPPLACACLGFCRDSRGWWGSGSAREHTMARNMPQKSTRRLPSSRQPWISGRGNLGVVTTYPLQKVGVCTSVLLTGLPRTGVLGEACSGRRFCRPGEASSVSLQLKKSPSSDAIPTPPVPA